VREFVHELSYEYEDTYWWYVARRNIVIDQVKRMSALMAMCPRILDYGCGTGAMLCALAEVGDASGMDVAPAAVAYCRARGMQQVTLLSAAQDLAHQIEGSYDIITLLDVLEHVRDDSTLLRILGGHLTTEGRLIITVPAYRFLWSGEDNISCHLRRYTRGSLLRVVRAAGLVPLKTTYFGTFLFPVQLLVVALNYCRTGSQQESYVRPLPRLLNATLQWVMALERFVLRRANFPLGGSILCCAARPRVQEIQ
jgi:SAM-dependent methyltransferase